MQDLTELAEDLRIVIGQLRRKLREQSTPEPLTWSQVSVIGHLSRNGLMTVTELAQVEGVRTQSMGATLSDLEKQHLVQFQKDDQDGRKKHFALTEQARELIESNRSQRDDWLVNSIQSTLSLEEIQTLKQSVALLQRLTDSST